MHHPDHRHTQAERFTIVADPDGNDADLMSPHDEARRTWPPEESPAPETGQRAAINWHASNGVTSRCRDGWNVLVEREHDHAGRVFLIGLP
jgi:hypothetical protein